LVRTGRLVLYLVFLWQKREYRIDRMRSHLETPLGRKLIAGPMALFKWLLFLIFLFVRESRILIAVYWLFWLSWIVEAALNLHELIIRGWKIPKLTGKAFLILLVSWAVLFLPIMTVIWFAPLFWAPLIDRLPGPLVAILVIAGLLPTTIIQRIAIRRARTKLEHFRNLKTVALTGSYGKTSTKEILKQILSSQYRVVATPGSVNTEIGIAKLINRQVNEETEVLIVEAGAYRRGEIAGISRLVKPGAAVITGIGMQHIDLFGSIENTVQAKYELAARLPDKGFLAVNGENKYCRQIAEKARSRGLTVQSVTTSDEFSSFNADTNGLNFKMNGSKIMVRTNLLGEHNLQNIAMAVVISREYFKLTDSQIVRALQGIEPADKTMKSVFRSDILTLVDDTFNVTYEGLVAAADYAVKYQGDKYLVLTPLIELGEKANEVHLALGRKLSAVFTKIIVTNDNYSTELKKKSTVPVKTVSASIISDILTSAKKETVVIFEGKEAQKWLKKMLFDLNESL